MKKIGIMTWIRYQNYGTALQATALSKVIQKLGGYEVFNIDYQPRPINDKFDYRISAVAKKAAQVIKGHLNPYYSTAKKTALYDAYLDKNLNITEPCNTEPELENLNRRMDAFVCGSDQIWSPSGFDPKYFLSFVRNPSKMVAYAPSIGLMNIKHPYVQGRMRFLINRFEHLSIREQQGADLIKELCGKEAKVVLDPTLLLLPSDWENIEKQAVYNESVMPKKYIICYFLGDYTRYMGKVREISRALHMPYFVIPQFKLQANQKDSIPFDVGPAEFLRLWSHSSYAITDSFHGTAFSLNFNIPFTVFKRFSAKDPINQNSRIFNILHITGMEGRLADEKNFHPSSDLMNCSFKYADEQLSLQRKESLSFLKDALEKAVSGRREREINVNEISLCCGCGACAAVCPVGAIRIEEDSYGFQHHKVDMNKCIRCGKCLQVCPYYEIQAPDLQKAKKLIAYRSKEFEHFTYSSSGGFSSDLAEYLSRKGYWVFGAVYDKKREIVRHIGIEPGNVEKLREIQGSKYLQSHTAEAFAKISRLSKDEKFVYFGTPCQVAALDKILRMQRRRDRAVLVDLICHGVPSQLLWRKYLIYIEKHFGIAEHPDVNFRSEKGGWHIRSIAISDGKRSYIEKDRKDPFYVFFRNALCDMSTCYDCPYRVRSAGDIKMGDFWGSLYEKDEKGVSMIIGVTDKGVNLIDELSGSKKKYDLNTYWTVQYPYNQQRPLFYEELIKNFKDENASLHDIRTEYAKGYEVKEKLGSIKGKVAGILRKK